ncbi:MAG: hypothetical protein HQL26_02830 [Candidatus Omnitrophica bacterium]|nr:hypothetical protein [Candidatus Omnitrophota bacterium]
MKYYLLNNKLYAFVDSGIKALDKEDAVDEWSGITGEVTVAVVDMEPLMVSVSDASPDKLDQILALDFRQKFGNEYLLQTETLKKNSYQVMGIHQDRVREIYALFGNRPGITIVPYSLLLRSVLIKSGLLQDQKPILFIDHFEDEVFFTAFNGTIIGKTRKMNSLSEQVFILQEIKRNEKNYQKLWAKSLIPGSDEFIYVSNWKILTDYLAEYADIEKEQVVFLDIGCPALEGLKLENLNINYCPPEFLIKKVRMKEVKNWLSWSASAGIVVLLAVGINIFLGMMVSRSQSQCSDLIAAKTVLLKQLKNLNKGTYRNYLKNSRGNWESIYFEFLNIMPDGYQVNVMEMNRTGSNIDFDVFLNLNNKDAFYEDIKPSSKFKHLQVQDVMLEHQPGKRIKVRL